MIIKYLLGVSLIVMLITGCDSKAEDSSKSKEQQLAEYKDEYKALEQKIKDLEEEMKGAEPDEEAGNKGKAVIVDLIQKENYKHPVVIQGLIESDENIVLSSEVNGNLVKLMIEEGQTVRKGQLVAKVDDEILQNQISELRTELDLAIETYNRQKNLWDQNIGSEIDYLTAKARKEGLGKKIKTVKSQIKKYNITSPISGTVDEVFVNNGEILGMGSPIARIVNTSKIKVMAEVSERYIGKFKVGDSVMVSFPSVANEVKSTIKSLGQVIDKNNRTFKMFVKLFPVESWMKPNLLAKITAYDLSLNDVITIPTRIVQRNAEGNFVYIVQKEGDKLMAKKIPVTISYSNPKISVIDTGLSENDQVILEGYLNVSDGELVKLIEE